MAGYALSGGDVLQWQIAVYWTGHRNHGLVDLQAMPPAAQTTSKGRCNRGFRGVGAFAYRDGCQGARIGNLRRPRKLSAADVTIPDAFT
jgi:hypothetical protein